MKKKYESPRAVADIFYPEESILDGVTIPGDLGADDTHGKLSAGSGCGWAENQIAEVDSNGKVTSLKEVNVMNYKILDCDVIKQDGDTVYWTTQSGKIRLWSHMGKIRSKSSSHLNMS